MKLAHGLGLVATASSFAFFAASAWLGCSSDTATPLGDAGAFNPAKDSGGSTGGDSGGTHQDSGASDAGGDAVAAFDCPTYCAGVMANCTGDNAQYISSDECLNACSLFPAGTAADTSGDTLGCRIYHTGLASTTPVPHCWHAGPYGYGGCGDPCADFCELAMDWCGPDAGIEAGAAYATAGDCTTACAAFTVEDAGTAPSTYNANGPQAGNTFNCREYHLGAALQGGDAQQLHCQHIGVVSPVCQ